MDYISVKEAASKLNLSERRIQKLCETNRIPGCQRLSGVWLIPSNATKPSDERNSNFPDMKHNLSLEELCTALSISTATGRNWIKLGKLLPKYTEKKTPYFSQAYVEQVKTEIQSEHNTILKSRRNKKHISGNEFYHSYVSETCKNLLPIQALFQLTKEENIPLHTENSQYLVAECALQLFSWRLNLPYKGQNELLKKYLIKEIALPNYDSLLLPLIDDKAVALDFCNRYPDLFHFQYTYEPNEDVLGLLYLSCKNLGSRKATGSYYTPSSIVKKLISKLTIENTHTILDPCCGTGNFLLQLPDHISFDQIYGNDLDPVSVNITRINMALKYSNVPLETIYEHITNRNYLTDYSKNDFHHVIGNPPWGYAFSSEEKQELHKHFKTANKKNIESYDVFIERALRGLVKTGQLSYILPETILNVRAHATIRSILLKICSIEYLEFLGNVFDGVQCPCILMKLTHTKAPLSTVGMHVNDGIHSFTLQTERAVTPACFRFLTTDTEYELMEKIKKLADCKYLANNADFALGIVTGDNNKYLSSKKTEENERILKGINIFKYKVQESDSYILYKPEHFQQTAPTNLYRAPEKLFYRFICNQLVFSYDDKQRLSLNSCNILIPKIDGLHIKYVLAILNSRVAQFLFQKEFHSVKVLRSHIESIPIPIANQVVQDQIISIVNQLIYEQNGQNTPVLYDELDDMIFKVYKLTKKEQEIIKNAIHDSHNFLDTRTVTT